MSIFEKHSTKYTETSIQLHHVPLIRTTQKAKERKINTELNDMCHCNKCYLN